MPPTLDLTLRNKERSSADGGFAKSPRGNPCDAAQTQVQPVVYRSLEVNITPVLKSHRAWEYSLIQKSILKHARDSRSLARKS